MKTINGNVLWTLPLLVLIPLVSPAQPHARAQAPVNTVIAIECERPYLSQADAARVTRTDNFSQTYAKRQSLYANVARACHRGVSRVLLVTDIPAERDRALATR